MPTYDYQCRSCGHVTEVIHSMLEDGPSACERCGGELRRILYPAGIIFKGSGFYSTDSRGTSSSASPSGKDKDAGSSGESSSGTGTTSSTGETSSAKEPKKAADPASST